ncbi:MAG: hypothetical protein LBJ15_02780 [Comamonas sp.]|uniref:hypothetical protein n=1 Tax=Comamonas sp. TaxID=34028 RepID=UPI0028179C5B|nr:hypothetical protein [Comamonas sp.]MDR0212912.1 hypothetical protein [Comamonas sp.]
MDLSIDSATEISTQSTRRRSPALASRALPLLAAFLLQLSFPTRADEAPGWESQASGSTSVLGVGAIQYFSGYRSVGYDHFEAEISVRWRSSKDGSEQEQILYEGILDKPPAKVWGHGSHLCVVMQACARGTDRCTPYLIAHRYNAARQSFTAVTHSSRLCPLPR